MAKVAGELVAISPWKKKLLAVFLVLAAVGAAMWVPARLSRSMADDPEQREAVRRDAVPPGASGFVAEGDRTGDGTVSTADSREEAPLPWQARLGGWMAKLGLSFAGGLVLGVFFRSFLKTMAAITALVVVGIVALSYFEVINVDFTTMRQNYDSAAGWVTEQGYRFKDAITTFLPSAASAGVGFFVGFIRR